MNFKYIMKREVDAKVPAWVVLELWEILNELNEQGKMNATEYTKEDIQELLSILEQKVDAIQRAAEYQREQFGKSKYDL